MGDGRHSGHDDVPLRSSNVHQIKVTTRKVKE
jgi:hypothetical protein